MTDFSTTYMGLNLVNPLIVASCSLTKDIDGVRQCAQAGASAVVLKSLFEEQIIADAKELERNVWIAGHAEAIDYVRNIGLSLGPREYLKLIEAAKKQVKIPIIASLNCVTPDKWPDFAKKIATAGADALELNISVMPAEPTHRSEEIERVYCDILGEVKKRISIPIAVKIGPYFTSMPRMASRLTEKGARALVLFNRFYQPDINIETMELTAGYRFSSPDEINQSLRWIALLSGRISCDFAASTGVHDAPGVIKQILAGAHVVQLCSTLYLNGVEYIQKIVTQVAEWMEEHGFTSIKSMQGKLSQKESDRPELYERQQYIKTFVGID